ncbi:Trk system potassium uptake protein TrkH [Crenothrix polyspora]|uniref:Trk system potassium uptake protein n=1 Tax=Crenothrix polyspora TaxID=360316 RepID=A0A1R4H3J7_9GAMM|nr:potassium transporter TrkG [Crenothrix polyspora]SJM90747.1 Trk system potassium uptake protein TrkH [Crenothrix polyspora]
MNVVFTVIHIFSVVVMVFSGLMSTCFLTSMIFDDGATQAFLDGTLITFLTGILMFVLTRHSPKKVSRQAGFLLVTMCWSMASVFCTLPLLLYLPNLSFYDAYFEVISGLTTTGATVLSGLDQLPMSINLWRHELTWFGGIGIIVFAVAILPILGIGGMQLLKSESPGSVKESDLPPRIAQTAKALWLAYVVITFVCVISLHLAGMGWFDAICHSFAAMSLGGFSTHDNSIGFFNSLPIEIVLTVFQLLAAMNFATHFLALKKRSFKPYSNDMEMRGMLFTVLSSCVFCAFVLWHYGTYPDFPTALRHATFNLVTVATTSGFMTQDFNQWPIFVPMWMLFLSSIAVSTGSTGGGIRMIRTIILMKQARLEMFKAIHPNAIRPMKIGGSVVSKDIISSVMGFIFLYFICVVALVFTLLLSDLDFMTAFSAVIATINNAGPGLNLVGPATNYAILTDFQTNVCTFSMLLGRVQIFSIVILFIPEFWKK